MKIFILIAGIGLLGSFVYHSKPADTVYVCVSPTAKKFHYSKSCPGLQKCTHEIKETTKVAAEKSGYTVCLKE